MGLGHRQGTIRLGQLKVVVGTLVQPRCQAHLGRPVRRGILILRPRRDSACGVVTMSGYETRVQEKHGYI